MVILFIPLCGLTPELYKTIGFSPDTPVNYGVQQFVDWYMSFYHGKKINNSNGYGIKRRRKPSFAVRLTGR